MIDDQALLDSADAAAGRPPLQAALAFTRAADCEMAELDARLLELHTERFGARLEAVASCPACEEELELVLDAAALGTRGRAARAEMDVEIGGSRVALRMPTAGDLAAVAAEADPRRARAALAERCLVGTAPGPLSDDDVAAISVRMAERDPLGGSRVAVDCPACGDRSELTLDLGWIVGRELAAEAARITDDVHAIASAYGWSEHDILALPPARRERYLERIVA